MTSYAYAELPAPIVLKLDPETTCKQTSKVYTHKREDSTAPSPCGTKFKLTETDISDEHHKRKQKPEVDLKSVVKVQSAIRRFLAIMRRRKELFGVICIFYIKVGLNVARLTVKSVLLKQTIKEKHTIKDKKDHHLLNKSEEVKEVNMIEGYWIICQNVANLENKFEKTLKQIPQRKYLIDFLKKAIVVEWSPTRTITSFSYRELTQAEIEEISKLRI